MDPNYNFNQNFRNQINETKPIGIDFNSFLPQEPPKPKPISEEVDKKVIDNILQQHESFSEILKQRGAGINTVAEMWKLGNQEEAIRTMSMIKDLGVINDFISMALIQSDIEKIDIKLDYILQLFPFITLLASSKYDIYIKNAVNSAWIILKLYRDVICQTIQAWQIDRGIDLNREDKIKKYNIFINYYVNFREIPKIIDIARGTLRIPDLNAGQFIAELHYFLKQFIK